MSKNSQCKKCQLNNELHKTIFGTNISDNLCNGCKSIQIALKAQPSNVTNRPSEWSPEIAEAMQYA